MNTEGIQSYRGKKVHDGNLKTKFQKLGLGLNLKECTSSFAPASQQRIKRLKPTNTRLKHQSEQLFVTEKTTKRPAPLCSFLGSQNSSNCCLIRVFVGFNLLIICWLAGANVEVHSFKFWSDQRDLTSGISTELWYDEFEIPITNGWKKRFHPTPTFFTYAKT